MLIINYFPCFIIKEEIIDFGIIMEYVWHSVVFIIDDAVNQVLDLICKHL